MDFEALPLWIAIPAALLIVLGSSLALLGSLGLVNVRSFYDRLHVPTLGSSWGVFSLILASMLLFGWREERAVFHELVIGIFVMVTTPVTLMVLGRAALQRDRVENVEEVPPSLTPPKGTEKEG